jgi:3-(3-hydroxy-phenyl)propionate hydroxylase
LMAGGRHMRFDEHVGFRFSLVARAGAVDALSEKTRETLAVLDVRVIELADGAQSGGQRILDVDGIYQRCLDDLGADLILIRPDFVLFGSAMATEVDDLVGALQEQLSRVVSQPALVAQLP